MNNSKQSPLLPATVVATAGIGSPPPPLPFSTTTAQNNGNNSRIAGISRGLPSLTSPVPNSLLLTNRHTTPVRNTTTTTPSGCGWAELVNRVGVEHVASPLAMSESSHEIVRPKPRRYVDWFDKTQN